MAPTPSAPLIYHLKIVLRDVTPLVWRRLLVASTTIADLHASIQIAMGWEDLHLHQFRIYGKAYGVYHDGGISFADDPHQVTLADFRFRAGERFLYEYDMGDFWQHDIWLERILPAESRRAYPHCSAGAGDCPPEDCGGPSGYHTLLHELTSWDAMDALQTDMGLIAERILAFANGGSRPTTDDLDFMDALERLQEREDWLPTVFDRRAVNVALRAIGKEYACTSSFSS
jgi:hypothetical protein